MEKEVAELEAERGKLKASVGSQSCSLRRAQYVRGQWKKGWGGGEWGSRGVSFTEQARLRQLSELAAERLVLSGR